MHKWKYGSHRKIESVIVKKNEIMKSAGKGIDLICTILCKGHSNSEKKKNVFPHMQIPDYNV